MCRGHLIQVEDVHLRNLHDGFSCCLTLKEFVWRGIRQAILSPQGSRHTMLVELSRSERDLEFKPAMAAGLFPEN